LEGKHMAAPQKSNAVEIKRNVNKRIRAGLTLFVVLFLVFVGLGSLGYGYYQDVFGKPAFISGAGEGDQSAEHADTAGLKAQAYSLKADLSQVLDSIKNGDAEKAEKALNSVDNSVASIRKVLDEPRWQLLSAVPGVSGTLRSVNTLLSVAEEASTQLLHPLVAVTKEQPLTELKKDGGFNVALLGTYLDWLEQSMPEIRKLAEQLGTVDLGFLDSDGKFAAYSQTLTQISVQFDDAEECIPLLRALMGSGEDKRYVFAAQNSAEIRSSGGFPGSVGAITIQDGVMRVEDFRSVYDVFQGHMSEVDWSLRPTETEDRLFGERMWTSHDACFNPDFERVAEIWARAYEVKTGKTVNGVISMTPVVMQKMLQNLNPITLSDGREINGDNATYVLQYEIYHDYFNKQDYTPASAKQTDALFAEAAKKTIGAFMTDFSLDKISGYLSIFREGFADRTVMLWMRDEAAQTLVRDLGWNAGLNEDAQNPEIGVYFSLADSSKLGWYLDLNTELGEPAVNVDGSRTYLLTVRMRCTLSQADAEKLYPYVIGHRNGAILGNIYIFAPAGGSLANAWNNTDRAAWSGQYMGHDVVYMTSMYVFNESERVFTVEVTTAPGVEAVPGFSMTPTLQAYRAAA